MWERRSAHVCNEEKDKWAPLRPAHMSEEEELEGGSMLRKRPTWRSEELDAFIETLDKRADLASTSTGRKERKLGSPLQSSVPDGLPTWMLRVVDSVLPD